MGQGGHMDVRDRGGGGGGRGVFPHPLICYIQYSTNLLLSVSLKEW